MTIQIDFPPELESRLREEAARQGQDAAEYVKALVEQHLVVSALAALKHRKPPQTVEEIQPRIPSPPGTSWLAQVVGQWPGEESDEEIDEALSRIS
jgi:hypothetical protein